MVAVGIVIELLLWFYILFVLARLVADWTQMFARSWAPRGPVLVLMEVIYTATDPPIRLFRRFIPPLRLGVRRSTFRSSSCCSFATFYRS